ncbi:MAG: alanyl-tRNA editing protein [Thaumarchaeota archaeon]|nr:alanyl-tRNA editing protein [Candidatus Geocrenenecus arthurdayi]MCL7388314.1 alanyl-tRNA editing protein [Candidatus Geocrenenecus arthurdayi]MCL7390488.1 alanyl-tRNA editing protein [Candidatus Geocrenenecus arthurdayi]MCL7395937.1 alanyl-tRNA editing protein [Candidatus Geocrenenecus arthurdayi]MCL7402727.1 alanyl-tRNA editing protein [Candidatus Geocrenenecus arthurdayi]
MTELLYLRDSYISKFEAMVTDITSEGIILDRTAFYPEGGGQPSDTGRIEWEQYTSHVIHVLKKGEEVYHVLSGEMPSRGTIVRGIIDWEKRYRHMRYHTALHILAGVVYHLYNSTITGSQIGEDKARIDFTLEDLSKDKVERIEYEANKIVEEGRNVKIRFIPREELVNNPELIRIKPELIPNLPSLRIVEIEGFDAQLDGGTHVSNTREVGRIKIVKTINKGKFNKRLEIVLL